MALKYILMKQKRYTDKRNLSRLGGSAVKIPLATRTRLVLCSLRALVLPSYSAGLILCKHLTKNEQRL